MATRNRGSCRRPLRAKPSTGELNGKSDYPNNKNIPGVQIACIQCSLLSEVERKELYIRSWSLVSAALR